MEAKKIVSILESALEKARASRTITEIARQAEIDTSQLLRFRKGERGLSIDSAARLMEVLGLGVYEDRRRKKQ